MSVKAILILCAQALLVKSAFGQPCASRAAGFASPYGYAASNARAYNGIAYNGLGAGCADRGLAYDGIYGNGIGYTATSGGGMPVSSASAIAPVGLSISSENVYEGALIVGGELPFVGTCALEGVVPSAGAGVVNHACGNGRNSMSSAGAAYAPGSAGYASGAYGYGAGYGIAGGIRPAAAAFAAPGRGIRAPCAGNSYRI